MCGLHTLIFLLHALTLINTDIGKDINLSFQWRMHTFRMAVVVTVCTLTMAGTFYTVYKTFTVFLLAIGL
jgi:hypothetical protein